MILIYTVLLLLQFEHFGFEPSEWFPGDELPISPPVLGLLISGLLVGSFVLFILISPGIKDGEAELEEMSTKEMRNVTGQNLLNFTVDKGQTDVSGSFGSTYYYRVNNESGDRATHFARIGLDMRLDSDAGGFNESLRIDNLRLGDYDDSNAIGDDNGGYITGLGSGTDGESFYFGPNFSGFNGCFQQGCGNNDDSNSFDVNSDGLVLGVDGNPIEAEGPYVELAFEDYNTDSPEWVGVRVGFEKIRGRASIANISQISTTIRAQDFGDNGNCTASGHRMNDCPTTGGVNALGLFNKVEFGNNGSNWGDSDGWTEDFWISFNRKDLFWDHQNPEAGTNDASEARFHTDGEGFWIHATDDVGGGVS